MNRTMHTQVRPGDRPSGNPRATRSSVFARGGMVTTSQPLASAAGLHALRRGGNAVDAAVTAAAVLAVVEPTMNGIGGDLFALVFDADSGRLAGLNSSGRAPRRATADGYRALGHTVVPARGPLSITVPGVVAGWAELLARHGSITLADALAPAILYARDGFPVAEIVAAQWRHVEPILAAGEEASRTFLPGGRAPRAGEVFANPALARTLERLARGGADEFYRGPLADRLAAALLARGALIEPADLAAHRATWVEPLRTSYRGLEVCEMPPNTQGLVALEILNILEGYDLRSLGHNSGPYLHLLVEAIRLAFADRDAVLADADHVPAALLETLVSKKYAEARRRAIDPDRAAPQVPPGTGTGGGARPAARTGEVTGDTVYLAVVDGRGNAVSLIQSLFESFGSGIVAGDTGVVFQNRGSLFCLDAAHPNCLAPAKRPMHTLIPGMALEEGRPRLVFGVMGGDMQPQGHVQLLVNLLDFGLSIQDAGDAARVRHSTAGVAVESGITAGARAHLRSRGHTPVHSPGVFGGFQAVVIDRASGVLTGGADMRKDGAAIGY